MSHTILARPPRAVKRTKPPPARQHYGVDRAALLVAWGEMLAAATAFELQLGVVALTVRSHPGHPDRAWLDLHQVEQAEQAAAMLAALLGVSPVDTEARRSAILSSSPISVPGGHS